MLDYSIKNDIRLYIATLLRRRIVHKPIYYVLHEWQNIWKTRLYRKIISQNKLVLIEKYIHFDNISELGESYNRSFKIHLIRKYIAKHW